MTGSKKANSTHLLVIWQSLVVRTYRTPFDILANEQNWHVGLCGPSAFRELGSQLRPWDQTSSANVATFPLPATVLHTQIMLLWGLGRILRTFFGAPAVRQDSPEGRRIVLCVAEPYSVTALWCYLQTRIFFGRHPFEFVTFGCQNIDKKFPWFLRRIETFVFTRSKKIWAVSAGQVSVLRSHGYRGPCLTIPLWYDGATFHPLDRTQADLALNLQPLRPLRIGFAGSLLEEKGILDLTAAMRQSKWLQATVALIVAGRGPLTELLTEQCSQANQSGGDWQLLGPLPPEKMASFYSAMDILVVPSQTRAHWKEQFGRVAVEALACGALVIASDSGELPAVIRDTSRLFPECNVAELSAMLEQTAKRLLPLSVTLRRASAQAGQWALTCSDREVARAFAQQL